MDVVGLGVETSCDETAAALVKNGVDILENPVFSQVEQHKKFRGVVPEVASRVHLQKLPSMLKHILVRAEKPPDYIAVTVRPGLNGCLLMGYHAALGVSLKLGIPLIPIHHLEAHLYAVQLMGIEIEYPFIGLLISGGNSALYLVKKLGILKTLGDTQDDACGEALDKAAVSLGLPYPGGPQIEKKAREFYEKALKKGRSKKELDMDNPLPEILKNQKQKEFDFSFSGIKTALVYLLAKKSHSADALAYYFQERVIQLLVRNTKKALLEYQALPLVAAGGVMANQTLRGALEKMSGQVGSRLITPPIRLCTDNAAMVASLGFNYFRRGAWPDVSETSPSKEFLESEAEGL